jgi:hypothetical protein
MRTSAPTSVDGIEKYLSSGMIRGIGPVYARKLVNAFGEKVFDISEAELERLREVGSIIVYAPSASRPPGRNRRSCGRSWCSCTAMASEPLGRSASTRPTGQMPFRS